MKTTAHRLLRAPAAWLLCTILAITCAEAGKPDKPPKPGDDGESHRYAVTVSETNVGDNAHVFWDDDPDITGGIPDSGDAHLLVNVNAAGGVNPYARIFHLAPYCESTDPPLFEGWDTCFGEPDGLVSGTLLVSTSAPPPEEPMLQLSFTAKSLSGKKLWYILKIWADPEDPAAGWDPYNLEVDHSAVLVLNHWRLAAGTGPESKGCVAEGDFTLDDASFRMKVTRTP